MKQYSVELEGLTPLLMHNDNLTYTEKITAWRRDPANKEFSVAGDDRTPPWTWIGCLYQDGKRVGLESDNLMTMLREGGAKILTGKGKETYKKQTQSGLNIDQQLWPVTINENKEISVKTIKELIGNTEFHEHISAAESLGFELFVKRAKIGRSKHIRVRPMFRKWSASGTITVIDESLSGITMEVLQKIFDYAGALCGIGDWRPSSPSSGSFGKFKAEISEI